MWDQYPSRANFSQLKLQMIHKFNSLYSHLQEHLSLTDSSVQKKYHVKLFLSFVIPSFPALLNGYACAPEYVNLPNSICDLLHHLDEHFITSLSGAFNACLILMLPNKPICIFACPIWAHVGPTKCVKYAFCIVF